MTALSLLRAALAGLLRGAVVAATLRELLAATVERDEAEAAHTNAGSPAARQRTMAEALPARQRYADAVDAAARELGVDVGALRAARAARLGALDGGR